MAIERLKEIYKNLSGEPTPDEEEAAQKELVGIFQKLVNTGDAKNKSLFEECLSIVQKWDPLELWFKEVPKLSGNLKTILSDGSPVSVTSVEKTEVKSSTDNTGVNMLSDEQNQKLSQEIADAISDATKSLPQGINIGQFIKTITEQVTKNFIQNNTVSNKTVEESKPESKKGLSKEDIMSNMLKDMSKKKPEPKPLDSSGGDRPRLLAPKVEIPKVAKPMQKIIPKETIESEMLNPEDELEDFMEEEKVPEKPKFILSPSAGGPQVVPQIKTPIQPQPQQPKSAPTVKLPEPKKISIPQPQRISIPQKIKPNTDEDFATEPAVETIKKPQIVIRPVGGIQDSRNITIEKQPITLKQISPVQPVSGQGEPLKIAQRPKITVKAQPVNQQPVQIQPISAVVPVIKPMNMQVNNSKANLIEAFNSPEKPRNLEKAKVGGITAVNIGGGDMDAFASQKVEMVSKKEEFESFESSDVYANKTKDELYQELIALEGKKYAIERTRKDMRTKHEKGMIQDVEYKTAIERYKYDLEHISDKINDIRKKLEHI